MSITFREFVELAEGKKKDLKRLKSAYMAGQELQPSPVLNIPAGEPNSPERASAIKKLMQASGGGAVRSAIKKREKKAEKAAKNILKQQEGFSYGSKSFQQELEKKRKQEAEEKETQRQKNADSARNAFRHEGGMVSYEKDPKTGKIVRGRRTKNGFTPDT
jgi:hypothetical protein